MCRRCAGLIEAIDRYIEKADKKVTDKLKQQGFADPETTRKTMDGLEDGIAEALEEETQYITGEVSKCNSAAAASSSLGRISAGDKVSGAIATTVQTQISNAMPNLINSYIKQTDHELKLTQVTEKTTAWVESWSKQLGSLMKTDSYKQLENILTNAMKTGKGIDDITRDIQNSGIRDERYRARRVALTEALRAHSVAQQEAYSQSPSVTGKMWCHTGEYRIEPRWNHMDMDGQIVPVNDPYILGGADGGTYEIMYPRDICLPPEESINCHCLSQPVVDPDILGMSLEERQAMQEAWFDEDQSDWEAELDEMRKNGYTKEDAKDFASSVATAKQSTQADKAWRVETPSEKEITEYHSGSQMMTTKAGSTIAVDQTGNIWGVCKSGSEERYTGKQLVQMAVDKGGTKLDSYSGNHEFYTKCGFEPVSWCKWDQDYAPADWKQEYGGENIIFYKYTGCTYETAQYKTADEFFKAVGASSDYDAAQAARDGALGG